MRLGIALPGIGLLDEHVLVVAAENGVADVESWRSCRPRR